MIGLWMLGLALAIAPEMDDADPPADETSVALNAPEMPDRTAPPEVLPAEWLDLDSPVEHDLGPGRTALYVRIPGVRKVHVRVAIHRGGYELDGGLTPRVDGMGGLQDVATAQHDAASLEILQDVQDMRVSSWMAHHAGGVDLAVPREQLALGLETLREVLWEPAYPRKDLKRHLRNLRVFYEVSGPASLRMVSGSALFHGWVPADHPYGLRPEVDAKLSSEDLVALQRAWRTSGPVTALVVGDVSWEDVEPLLREALDGLGAPVDRAEDLAFSPPTEGRVVAIDMPGQMQSALRARYAAPVARDPDRVAFETMNWAFGGHFLSRLNANLREDKGFTYGARSSYSPDQKDGSFSISVDVKSENTAAAILEIEHELNRLRASGITAAELDMARQAAVSDWNGTRETAGSASWRYERMLLDRETLEEVQGRGRSIDALTPEDAQRVAETWLGEDAPCLWVVAGDREAIGPQLESLGWTVEWITPQQAILGAF